MVEEKITENEKDIIRIGGELKLINQKLDNHVHHISVKIVWTCSFMILALLLRAIYSIMAGQSQKKTFIEGLKLKKSRRGGMIVPLKQLTKTDFIQ